MDYSNEFLTSLNRVLQVEGGFTDDPADPGGATNRGITLRLFQEYRPGATVDDLRAITADDARDVYLKLFWNGPHLHVQSAAGWDASLGDELFDTGVNCGTQIAAGFFQMALNTLNFHPGDGADLFSPLKVDGWCGPSTIAAMNAVAQARGPDAAIALARYCDCFQGVRYAYLVLPPEQRTDLLLHLQGRPALKKYALGWALKRLGGR
jgi:typhoid toxin secretion A